MKYFALFLLVSGCSLWQKIEPEVEDWAEEEIEKEWGVRVDIDLPPTPKINQN